MSLLGKLIPDETEVMFSYKRKDYRAKIKNGHIFLEKKEYVSPSAAGRAIAGHAVNGWRLWRYYDKKTGKWTAIDKLRR